MFGNLQKNNYAEKQENIGIEDTIKIQYKLYLFEWVE